MQKTQKKHVVHLSAFSAQHFKFIKEISSSGDDSSWVLPATNNLEHVDIKSLTKQISRRQRGDSIKQILSKELESSLILPKGKWTSHDLRRTGATLMGTLGVRPEVIEKCLNHLQKNVLIRIYQRQELVEEQREAWNLLGTYLSNIAPFKGNSV